MEGSMGSAIRLRSAVALQGRFPVLSGVDLDLDQGRVMVVLGANGAGKTSLLRFLAGLVPIASGRGEVLGADLATSASDVRRRVGLLGHDAGLHDELTPLENLAFALRASRLDPGRALPALDRVGLSGRSVATTVGQLSAGQRRRVGIALLVARRPQLWLLDEPHASLDEVTRSLVAEVVEEAAFGGAAVVASSHEPDLAVPMADVVATMGGGAVLAVVPGGRVGGGHVA